MVQVKIKHVLIIPTLIIIFLGTFSYVMNNPINHDENMYITASVMIQKSTLYKDFGYLQMPFLPLLYGLIYKLTGFTYYLLLGRLFSLTFIILSALLVYLISYRLSKEKYFSLCMLILFTLNKIVINEMGFAWNLAMPTAFALAAFYLFILSVSEKRLNLYGIFFSGFFLALAIGTKSYYIATLPSFLIVSFLYPASLSYRKRISSILLPFLAGVTVGALPALYYLIKDFNNFIFNNFFYHAINPRLWHGMVLGDKAKDAVTVLVSNKRLFFHPTNVAVFIGCYFIFLLFVKKITWERKVYSLKQILSMEGALSLLLFLSTMVTIFSIRPMRLHYVTLSLPFAIIMMGCFFKGIPSVARDEIRTLLACLVSLNIVFCGIPLTMGIGRLVNAKEWTGVYVHHVSEEIRKSIGIIKNGDKIATLSPLYMVEAGLPIYNELSTGPFLYRIGDSIPEDKRAYLTFVSAKTLYNLFEKDPPRAIFVGFEGTLDLLFVKYAKEKGYVQIKKNFDRGGRLYIKIN